jgi:opacity protein-like surface antigen
MSGKLYLYLINHYELSMKTFSKSLLIIPIVIFCFQLKAYSQVGSMAHVAFGASFPTGDFANNDFTNPSSGFAQIGFNLNLQYAYKFNEYLGLGAAVTGDVHNYDYSAVKEGLREDFESVFQDIDEIFVNTRQWASGGILAGAAFSLPLSSRLALDLRVLGGFLYVHSPELSIEVVSTTNPGFFIIDDDKAVTFAWDFGAGLRYDIRGKKYIILQYDYQGSRPKFKDQKSYLILDDEVIEDSQTYTQDIRVMNLTVGLGYYID